ncbi:kinesin-like protein KIF14 isoform X2 [Daphnia carinata]|uniref:kinesin-like protein KIF14 isoform X2 n=1 Tax=Daphnia carinata TaxID=120202 RepID=UPI00257FAAAB|nr:kinesin-like protein KIF14 isoform X2 [Daphnia carinata]
MKKSAEAKLPAKHNSQTPKKCMTSKKQKTKQKASSLIADAPNVNQTVPKEKKKKVQTSSANSIIVAVRVRPKTAKEESEKQKPAIFVEGKNISVLTSIGETHIFCCDNCFISDTPTVQNGKHHQQGQVYECLAKPLLSQAFKGFNTCMFAYGQTGTGKSYSMMGKIGNRNELDQASGIIPRFCFDLFLRIEELAKNPTAERLSIEIEVSFFEIYKERIQDLLCSSSKTGGNLSVREHPKNGPYVVNLTKCSVTSFEEVQRWLSVGNQRRIVASTSDNKRSSRSHVIFTITLAQSFEEQVAGKMEMVRKQSRVNFIDLAGSERMASLSVGVRRQESLAINLSLFTLGKVITALAEKKFAPYRESVLTWLLKESLGGNSKTVMLATVSPNVAHIEATLSTLRYSCLASKIVNAPTICETPKACSNKPSLAETVGATSHVENSPARIKELESTVRHLSDLLAEVENKKDSEWKEKMAQAELKRIEAEQALSNHGLSSYIDPQQPYLININRDPLLSETMFFPLNPGKNMVGPMVCSNDPPSIQLNGLTIEENHCCIEYDDDLRIFANAETYVNGQLVGTEKVVLCHGDRIIIGGTHHFHLHNPKDSQFHEKRANGVPDFETSYQELRDVQEKVLQVAVEEAQQKARQQMISEISDLRREANLEISFRQRSNEDKTENCNGISQEQQLNATPSASINWQELELLLRDSQRKLEQPPNNPLQESSFVVQSMLNEANSICRRFHQPYRFTRKEAITEDLQSAICVKDQNLQHIMYWSFDKMKQRLKALRDAVQDSKTFPTEVFFDGGDIWQREDDASVFFAPATRAKLERLLKGVNFNDSNVSFLDESKFSYRSPRRSSLLPRSPTVNERSGVACQELIHNFAVDENLMSAFCSIASCLQSQLDHPDCTSSFAITLTSNTLSLLSVFPGLVDFMLSTREVPANLRINWAQSCKELKQNLQKCVEFVLQGVSLDSAGLFNQWIDLTKDSLNAILTTYGELAVVVFKELPCLPLMSRTTTVSSFVSALSKVHESLILLAEGVKMKIEQLPNKNSPLANPSLADNGCHMANACYSSIHHVTSLLEDLRPIAYTDFSNSDEMELEELFLKHRELVDVLFCMGKTIDQLFLHLELNVLSQVKVCAAALKAQAFDYANRMGASDNPFLSDLSFAILTIHRLVAEKRRMVDLQRGRNIHYSPVPPQMLVTPTRKPNVDDTNDLVTRNV